MKRRLITDEIFNQILTDYNNGMSVDDIASKYNFHSDSIKRHLKENGVYIPKAKKFTKEEIEGITTDYLNGMRPYKLAEKYNRDSGTIIGKLKSLGVFENANYHFTKDDIEFLKIYYPLNDWDTIMARFPNLQKGPIHTKMYKLGISADAYHDKKWKESEIEIIKKYYEDNGPAYVHNLLPHRSVGSISCKAEKLGLRTREYWTESEDEIMRQHYHSVSMDKMLTLLPQRSKEAIINHARKLNLRSSIFYTEEEAQFIKDNWMSMSDKEIGDRISKNHRGVAAKRISLGLLRVKEESSYNNLSEYIRRNNIEWKTESMRNCGYKCAITGARFDDIHHIYGLNLILNETLDVLNMDIRERIDDYTEEEMKDILYTFREIQSTYPLGVCLSKQVHMDFHNKFGYGNNTQEQWNDFIANYNNPQKIVVA